MTTTSSEFISHSFHGTAAEILSGCFAVSWGKVRTEYDSKQTASQTHWDKEQKEMLSFGIFTILNNNHFSTFADKSCL